MERVAKPRRLLTCPRKACGAWQSAGVVNAVPPTLNRTRPVGAITFFSHKRLGEEILRQEIIQQAAKQCSQYNVLKLVNELAEFLDGRQYAPDVDVVLALEIIGSRLRAGMIEGRLN